MLKKTLIRFGQMAIIFLATGYLLRFANLSWFTFEAYKTALFLVVAVFVVCQLFVERLSKQLPDSRFLIQFGNQVLRIVLLLIGLAILLLFKKFPQPLHLAVWFMFFYVVFTIVDIKSILDTLRPDLKS
jgi:hypothetical protein